MPPAAGVVSHIDRVPMTIPTSAAAQQAPAMVSDTFAKDAIISWFRGEFAAANAIIDALCSHLTQLEMINGGGNGNGGGSEYESAFSAIHQRRLNWIPILQMQKYFSIADVSMELRRVVEAKKKVRDSGVCLAVDDDTKKIGDVVEVFSNEKVKSGVVPEEHSPESNGGDETLDEDSSRDDSPPKSEITDTGSQDVHPLLDNIEICSNDEDWEARCAQIKMTKGFVAKEPVKGHTVNVVRGLKLYEDIFSETELSKLSHYVNELRAAGENGELSGETFIMYNQQSKGIKRELIQLGVPIFGQIKDDATSPKTHIEPIPSPLEGVIDHLIQWHLISENRRPNSCIINYFDEGEFSQPFLKPPHLDQPITTILLAESTMAFGRTLVCDNVGNYKGPLMLTLKEGSLLVMRGNSADMARHVMCQSPQKRISITFFKVKMETNDNNNSAIPPMTGAMTLWQPGIANPYATPLNGYEPMDVIPKWGVLRAPLVMLAPVQPVVVSPRRLPRGGTGVFLPWTVGSRKPAKHLPPRAQKGRLLALPAPVESHKVDKASESAIATVA